MKPILPFDGIYISSSPEKPWMLAARSVGSYVLYGRHFHRGLPAGLACSSGFDSLPIETLAPGAYFIDTAPLPEDKASLLLDHGPVVDATLPPLTICPLTTPRSFSSMVEAIQCPHTLAALTSVSIDIYAQIFRVLGAKIGRFDGKEIAWEKHMIFPDTRMAN